MAALEARTSLSVHSRVPRCRAGRAREILLPDAGPFVPLTIEKRGKRAHYAAKAVMLGKQRYIVCINQQEAEKDAAERQANLPFAAGLLSARRRFSEW